MTIVTCDRCDKPCEPAIQLIARADVEPPQRREMSVADLCLICLLEIERYIFCRPLRPDYTREVWEGLGVVWPQEPDSTRPKSLQELQEEVRDIEAAYHA